MEQAGSGGSWWTRGRIIATAAAATAFVVGLTVIAVGVVVAVRDREPDPLQQRLDGLVDLGFPAAIATVTTDEGDRAMAAGVEQRGSEHDADPTSSVRIGSNTKMFTSVAILQLVAKDRIDLDASVDTYLPDVLRRSGLDGSRVTVRQLLQHTSGLPDYVRRLPANPFSFRDRYLAPRDLLDLAGGQRPTGAPGERWTYSNTNFLVAGMIAERVSGRPLPELVKSTIIKPLGLRHTRFPGPGDRTMGSPALHGYARTAKGRLGDITTADTSWAWAAGQMVSTPADLNRFMRALVGGRVLPRAQLQEMQRTVASTDPRSGTRYGLGLMEYTLSCGKRAWGHGGDVPGYETRNAVTEDGTAVTVAVSALPAAVATGKERIAAANERVNQVVDAELCTR